MDADLLRDVDVAKRFNVAPSTVRGWVSAGLFHKIKLGRCLRFDPNYVESRLEMARRGEDFFERVVA